MDHADKIRENPHNDLEIGTVTQYVRHTDSTAHPRLSLIQVRHAFVANVKAARNCAVKGSCEKYEAN